MDAGVFESAPVQSPPGSHHRPGAHHRDRNRVLSFPQNAGGTAEKESLVAFRASTELSRGRDSGRRPFLGAPSRLSSDRTGGSVISTLEEKDSYDVGGAKSDGHGGAESSCQKQQIIHAFVQSGLVVSRKCKYSAIDFDSHVSTVIGRRIIANQQLVRLTVFLIDADLQW